MLRLHLTRACLAVVTLTAISACGPTAPGGTAKPSSTSAKAAAAPSSAAPSSAGDATLGLNMTGLPADSARVTSTSPMLRFDPVSESGWDCQPGMYGATCTSASSGLSADVTSFYNDAFVSEHPSERDAPKITPATGVTCVDTKDDAGKPFVSCWTPFDDATALLRLYSAQLSLSTSWFAERPRTMSSWISSAVSA